MLLESITGSSLRLSFPFVLLAAMLIGSRAPGLATVLFHATASMVFFLAVFAAYARLVLPWVSAGNGQGWRVGR